MVFINGIFSGVSNFFASVSIMVFCYRFSCQKFLNWVLVWQLGSKKIGRKNENAVTKIWTVNLVFGSLTNVLLLYPLSTMKLFQNWIHAIFEVTWKNPLCGYVLGVLTPTTAWDQQWGGDGIMKWVSIGLRVTQYAYFSILTHTKALLLVTFCDMR